MEAGIDHFAVTLPDPVTGWPLFESAYVPNFLQEVGPADRVGLDQFCIGSHRRTEALEARAAAVQ